MESNSGSTSSTTMVVSTVLEDFYGSNQADLKLLTASCTVLFKLIQNALQNPNDTKYHRIRLQNNKIQTTVVKVPGALDILGLAGFKRKEGGGGNNNNNKDGNTEQEPSDDSTLWFHAENSDVGSIICHQLETKLTELERGIAEASTPNSSSSSGGDVFLSQEERDRRRKAAKASQKAKKEARTRALQAWKEDEEDRRVKAARKEAAMQQAPLEPAKATDASLLHPEIRIKKLKKISEDASDTAVATGDVGALGDNSNNESRNEDKADENKMDENNMDVDEGTESPQDEAMKDSSTTSKATPKKAPPASTDTPAQLKSPPQEPVSPKPASAAAAAAAAPMETESKDEVNTTAFVEQWKEYMKNTPRCSPAEGIRATSYFSHKSVALGGGSGSGGSPPCLRKLFKELDTMNESLPSDPQCTIFVRFDEETPQYIRAIIPAALPGPTPYAGGLFCFDLYVPDNYPQQPPRCQLLTTGGGSVRFGPNLYADGKVCLSLLGTWDGPRWKPGVSTLNQVLISIQGLILGAEHPYYLEPGHGGWEGRIKEGDFAKTGHTLAGTVVQEDLVPLHVAVFENKIRVGTIRFAMLDLLKQLVKTTGKTSKADNDEEEEDNNHNEEADFEQLSSLKGSAYLQPFLRPMWLHFHHNREGILKEVRSWARSAVQPSFFGKSGGGAHDEDGGGWDDDDGYEEDSNHTQQQTALLQKIATLSERLETTLANLDEPPLEAEPETKATKPSPSEAASIEPLKPAAKPTKTTIAAQPQKKVKTGVTKSIKVASVEELRQKMQDAAASGDFILAGKLQESLNTVQDLETRMKEAAQEGNFIRAGRLQEQLNVRLQSLYIPVPAGADNDEDDKEDAMEEDEKPAAFAAAASAHYSYSSEEEQDDDEAQAGKYNYDDGYDDQFNSGGEEEEEEPDEYADDGHNDTGYWNSHKWGSGTQLKAFSSVAVAAAPQKSPAKPAKSVPFKSKRSSGVTCRLRIRLPGQAPITDQFDGLDTLADVYGHLDQFINPEEANTKKLPPAARQKHVLTPHGPQMMEQKAFAQPLSLKGFTLLLAHPKREFSLEMHGTMTLGQLGLVPSATLDVMMCQERGVVRRGALESRLDEAEGDAMDVEGLTYEGLLELTERVGKGNESRVAETREKLDSCSSLISPAAYLKELSPDASEKDRRCPICLGDFDAQDESASLRRLHACNHVFHMACLDTWLQTKTACPMCNQDVAP